MSFLPDGSIRCDTCPTLVPKGTDEANTVQYALAMRWGLFAGTTQGGEVIDVAACPGCRGESKKRAKKVQQTFEDTPLFEE